MTSQTLIPVLATLAAMPFLLWPRTAPPWSPTPTQNTGADERQAVTHDLLPEGLDLLALALQSGGSVGHAALAVGAVLPPGLGAPLRATGEALVTGASPDEAWEQAGPEWAVGRQSLRLAGLAGTAPADALTRAASEHRAEAVARVEASAARLGVALVLPLGLAFLPAFVLTTIVPVVVALMKDLTW